MNTLDEKIRFLWLDVETTGLESRDDLLLEVAAWPSRSNDPLDLDPGDARKWVVHHDGGKLGEALSPFTWRMHTSNGLLPEVIESKLGTGDIEDRLADVIGVKLVGGVKSEKSWHLAGNSIHFDRGFLHMDVRRFEGLLSHRHLDVTSLLLAARSAGADIPKAEPAHRAMDDVKQSIRLYYDCMMFFRCGVIPRSGLDAILDGIK